MKATCSNGHDFEYQERDVKSHFVMCGDSTDKANVDLLMNGDKADMVFTDPPYGMNLDTDYTKMGDGGRKHELVIGDDKPFDYSQFDWLETKEQFWFGGDYYAKTLPDKGGWLVWDKYSRGDDIGLLDGRFGSAFELCWSKQPHKRELIRIAVTTNYTARGDETRTHPTQKPVALASWFIKKYSKQEQNILDLFLGSGSTLIACEQTDRTCYGMELDPKYVDVIRKRYAKFTNNNELPDNWEELTPVVK